MHWIGTEILGSWKVQEQEKEFCLQKWGEKVCWEVEERLVKEEGWRGLHSIRFERYEGKERQKQVEERQQEAKYPKQKQEQQQVKGQERQQIIEEEPSEWDEKWKEDQEGFFREQQEV